MNKQEYLEKRKALLAEAEAFLNEGKLEEFEVKEKEIKDLDEQFEKLAKAQANMNALKEPVINQSFLNMNMGDDGVMAKNEPKTTADEKQVYLNAWAKNMMGMVLEGEEKEVFDKVNYKYRNEVQTTQQHAVLIPETVVEGIWREAGELYPILGDVRMTFVPGDVTILKEENSGDDAAWYDEATEVADGSFVIGELNLKGCELAKNIPVSWKLRKMAINDFVAYIQTLLAEKMGAALAKAIVAGKGKPGSGDTFKAEPKGIVTALEAEAGTPQIVEFETLSYDDLAKAMGKIKSAYKSGAAIYAKSATVWNTLATLKDNDGRPLFVPDVTSDGVGRIFGVPVKEEDAVPEDVILIGNVERGYAMNVNENMTIYTEDHIKQRYTDYMGYAIVDGDVLTSKAFAVLRKALPSG
ncbi:major capsid protein [Caldibacillus phage CBP1]|uniref:Phage major capsid protein, HK97 family n=1 Tax=Caldibacillus debilis GB1 TaxID=1339248 RepID=A0A420VIQ3_9BACI|nr:phage major capsid protein [Caldibacillus debilis]ATB52729.1 major capsid protein [Caldibacillus phage CBP1]RKO63554.1 phage major capsid protein, HK97 family [Caldibacillus debilis GB1]